MANQWTCVSDWSDWSDWPCCPVIVDQWLDTAGTAWPLTTPLRHYVIMCIWYGKLSCSQHCPTSLCFNQWVVQSQSKVYLSVASFNSMNVEVSTHVSIKRWRWSDAPNTWQADAPPCLTGQVVLPCWDSVFKIMLSWLHFNLNCQIWSNFNNNAGCNCFLGKPR